MCKGIGVIEVLPILNTYMRQKDYADSQNKQSGKCNKTANMNVKMFSIRQSVTAKRPTSHN